jgi:hypothetical protein
MDLASAAIWERIITKTEGLKLSLKLRKMMPLIMVNWKMVKKIILFIFLVTVFIGDAFAETITGNSFLIEEGVTQDYGVVQHIFTYKYSPISKNWISMFTQEWPFFSENHQLSYSVPYLHNDNPFDNSIGDVVVHYKYQLLLDDIVALAPRLAIVTPSGDYKKGFGNGNIGYQGGIPFSVYLTDDIIMNWNMVGTYTTGKKNSTGIEYDALDMNFGIGMAVNVIDNIDILFESVWNSYEILDNGIKGRNDTAFINPGIRGAIRFDSGLEIVPGISTPIGVGPSNGEYSVFLYLSFEHWLF